MSLSPDLELPCHEDEAIFARPDTREHARALTRCWDQCPVREECLAVSLELEKKIGYALEYVAGGYSQKARKRMLQPPKRRKHARKDRAA